MHSSTMRLNPRNQPSRAVAAVFAKSALGRGLAGAHSPTRMLHDTGCLSGRATQCQAETWHRAVMTRQEPSSVLDLADRVRDLVNDPYRHAALQTEPAKFNQLCAAMDLIEDAGWGLNEYLALESGASVGYLALYGVMQALFMQQDGVRDLMKALGLEGYPSKDDRLRKPRETRNAATGHPTSHPRGGQHSSFRVSRVSMVKEGFSLLGVERVTGVSTREEVEILDLIAGQEESLSEVLRGVVRALEG